MRFDNICLQGFEVKLEYMQKGREKKQEMEVCMFSCHILFNQSHYDVLMFLVDYCTCRIILLKLEFLTEEVW